MTHQARQMLKEAHALPEEERIGLASDLLESVEGAGGPEWGTACAPEIDARVRQVLSRGVRIASLVASCGAVGCRFDYFALTRLVLGPGVPLAEGGGVGWDGVTLLSKDLFVEASTPMAYSEAQDVASVYDKSLPRPSPFGTATVSGDGWSISDVFSECAYSFPTFDCIVSDQASFTQRDFESGSARMEVVVSDFGAPEYDPYADIDVDMHEVERAEYDAEYYNVGPETRGAILFVVVEWNFMATY